MENVLPPQKKKKGWQHPKKKPEGEPSKDQQHQGHEEVKKDHPKPNHKENDDKNNNHQAHKDDHGKKGHKEAAHKPAHKDDHHKDNEAHHKKAEGANEAQVCPKKWYW